MPTYKDVFLNVARVDYKIEDQKMEKKHRIFIIQIIIMIKYYYETEFREDYSKKYTICNDLKVCFNHIFLLTTINIK